MTQEKKEKLQNWIMDYANASYLASEENGNPLLLKANMSGAIAFIESLLKEERNAVLSEVERLEGLEVSCVDDRLLGKSDDYLEGYNTSTERWREQRDDQITNLQAQIKKLEV